MRLARSKTDTSTRPAWIVSELHSRFLAVLSQHALVVKFHFLFKFCHPSLCPCGLVTKLPTIRARAIIDSVPAQFLKHLEAETPAKLELHLIADNYATHKHPKVKAWIAKHPRVHLHFTPTSSSWLNLVERFFRDLSEDVVREGSFTSTRELTEAMVGYLIERNLAPVRYEWRASGAEILAKIQRAREKQAHILNTT